MRVDEMPSALAGDDVWTSGDSNRHQERRPPERPIACDAIVVMNRGYLKLPGWSDRFKALSVKRLGAFPGDERTG